MITPMLIELAPVDPRHGPQHGVLERHHLAGHGSQLGPPRASRASR